MFLALLLCLPLPPEVKHEYLQQHIAPGMYFGSVL